MNDTLGTLLAAADRAALTRERDLLRARLASYDAMLELLDGFDESWLAAAPASAETAVPADGNAEPQPETMNGTNGHSGSNGHNGNGVTNGHKHARLADKRNIALAIMEERPGRWTTSEMRDALRERGIEPEAGTPVKNVFWWLAKAGVVRSFGGGVYEYPVPTKPAALDDNAAHAEQEAMGV